LNGYLFIFDEADRLDEDTFEFLRSMTDLTRIPIALVGLPGILKVAKTHGKFQNRVAMKIQFEAIDEEELIQIFLPQLILPRWSFNPDSSEDQEMGHYLWKRVCPVLRRVRKLLRIASKIAAIDGAEHIQLTHIKEAFTIDPDGQTPDEDEADDEDNEDNIMDERHGSHEEESEKRRDAKERRQKRGHKKQ
jgi:DNA transposition AAA+ family ATPase